MKFPRRQRNTSAKAKPHKRSATSDSKPSSKSTILAIAIPVIVTVIGAWAAQSIAGYYSRQQREIAQAEAAEKFMPYFDNDPTKHSPQQRYLAIQSLIEIGSYDAAADLVVALPHDYAAIQKARKTADTEGESGKEKSAGDTAQHEPNGQKEDGTTSADDKNFAQILSIYYPKLLPRLAYLAGSANSISKVKQSLGTAVDQTAGSKSVDAIKLIMGDPGGLEAVKSIAFTPAILQSSWLDRVYFRYEQLKLSIFGKKEELTLERTRRLGAIVSINSRIEEITDHIDVFARGEGTRKRLLNRYQSLSQPLMQVVFSPEDRLYTVETRVKALHAANLLESPLTPSPHLAELQHLVMDSQLPSKIRVEIIDALLQSGNLTSSTISTIQSLVVSNICDNGRNGCWEVFVDLMDGGGDQLPAVLRVATIHRLSQMDDGGNWLISWWDEMGGTAPELIKLFDSASDKRKAAVLYALVRFIDDKNPELGTIPKMVESSRHDASPEVRAAAYQVSLSDTDAVVRVAAALQDNSPFILQRALTRVKKGSGCDLLKDVQTHIAQLPEPNDRAVTLEFLDAAKDRCSEKKATD